MNKDNFVLNLIGAEKMVSLPNNFVLKEHISGSSNKCRMLSRVNHLIKNLYFTDFDEQFGKLFSEEKENSLFFKKKETLWYADITKQVRMNEAVKEIGGDNDNTVNLSKIFSKLKEYREDEDINRSVLRHTNFFFVRDILNDIRMVKITRARGFKWEGYGWCISFCPLSEIRYVFLDKGDRIFFT